MSSWLICDEQSEVWKIGFRWGGRLYKRSLGTTDGGRAKALHERVNAALFDLKHGRMSVPPGADLLTFLLSDGRQNTPQPATSLTLKALFDAFNAALPDGAKSTTTLATEKVHQRHFMRILGERLPVNGITLDDLQRYVKDRTKGTGKKRNEKPVGAGTIKKDLDTLSAIWRWGRQNGKIAVDLPPRSGLFLPKTAEKEPFQTRTQIEARIGREKLTKKEIAALWGCLYLDTSEISKVLAHVRDRARAAWVYPIYHFVAHTGARRSEAVRSQIDDFNLEEKFAKIREKKKGKGRITYRHVPLSASLIAVLKDWFAKHPGGQFTFSQEAGEKLDVNMSNHHFHWALEGSDWHGKIRGWHVFRHSFASNCARSRVDHRMIDEWMGHQTAAMRERYRHLFPDDQHEQLALAYR